MPHGRSGHVADPHGPVPPAAISMWDPSSETGIVSTVKFKGEAAALDRAGHVAQNVPATVVVPALTGN